MPQFNKRGNRIRASDKSLVFRFSAGLLLPLFFVVVLLLNLKTILTTDWKSVSFLKDGSVHLTVTSYMIVTVIVSALFCAIAALLYQRFQYDRVKQLFHRQKLAKMILENGWYESETTQDSGFFKDLPATNKKEKITYFPKLYYRMDNGLLYIRTDLLEDAGWDVLPPGLAGALATLQLRVLLDHVLPELVLPLHKVLAVADDFLGAQPPVSRQGYKTEVQMGRFLVHVDDGREKGVRALLALQEFQGILKVRLDFAARLALEKLRAGGDECLHHPHTVLADTAVGGSYHAVGFFPVSALRLHQMEVVAAPVRIDVRVAGILLLGALIVGFNGADSRPLVLFES